MCFVCEPVDKIYIASGVAVRELRGRRAYKEWMIYGRPLTPISRLHRHLYQSSDSPIALTDAGQGASLPTAVTSHSTGTVLGWTAAAVVSLVNASLGDDSDRTRSPMQRHRRQDAKSVNGNAFRVFRREATTHFS